ncbi:hypothetical protein VF14_09950 [Nostoc linckia z18]|uniref:Uncharacterized protein n=2 Tax=Nostoc linckia TaxID=92942 RepID=A0A9Q5ZBG8_NOSLI|nr:hypothetical protein VF02_07775 [Nostoc linckia z1]PHJ71345.1 hypothetical protein VF05_07635 [Nostoc linckia z3]PHJ75377.1 hypothetical protein VF03_10675 [Nostoc linckia z2]PHJ84178.1 hypothetical protein VF06_10380 [Nostoc linckia z4]PHJ90745.1 hypothetical protein VF07_07455 [Nostoc linckia z6]PHJ95015.1 hypothetical protein VF04_20145 [Nostoc linckia z7]PHK03047.1 hypothetical protein VF08_16280 [Nostoc linckia z8]PHK11334.1 hypothetical protein VF09_07550 [Nostoc linckia z9]PHK1778
MLGGGWVKVKGKRGKDKKHESLSPCPFKEPSRLGVLLPVLFHHYYDFIGRKLCFGIQSSRPQKWEYKKC